MTVKAAEALNTVASYVPDVPTVVGTLIEVYKQNNEPSWQTMKHSVISAFTPEVLTRVEVCVPGWQRMAGYDEGQTLVHVCCVFLSFYTGRWSKVMSVKDKYLLEWVILLHDLSKIAHPRKRDRTHAFRSAVMAARILPLAGFPVLPTYNVLLDEWSQLTETAVMPTETDDIQNNRQLPQIVSGIEQMFGKDSAAAIILKAILLHHSFSPILAWPNPAPLTAEEIKDYITPPLWAVLGPFLCIDTDAWDMFEPEMRSTHQEQSLACVTAVKKMI